MNKKSPWRTDNNDRKFYKTKFGGLVVYCPTAQALDNNWVAHIHFKNGARDVSDVQSDTLKDLMGKIRLAIAQRENPKVKEVTDRIKDEEWIVGMLDYGFQK